jgi:hypothetical protein
LVRSSQEFSTSFLMPQPVEIVEYGWKHDRPTPREVSHLQLWSKNFFDYRSSCEEALHQPAQQWDFQTKASSKGFKMRSARPEHANR